MPSIGCRAEHFDSNRCFLEPISSVPFLVCTLLLKANNLPPRIIIEHANLTPAQAPLQEVVACLAQLGIGSWKCCHKFLKILGFFIYLFIFGSSPPHLRLKGVDDFKLWKNSRGIIGRSIGKSSIFPLKGQLLLFPLQDRLRKETFIICYYFHFSLSAE